MLKLRPYTCKIVLATSLVWFICGLMLMMYYTDCIGDNSVECQGFRNRNPNSISVKARKFFRVTAAPATTAVDDNFRYWSPVVVNSNPSHWPGEMGRAVVIPPEEEELRKEKFKLNQFNLLASDRIALNRTLPDVRAEGCKGKEYAPKLPSTSIVIVFHNEAWSTLLRTIHSVIRMSPKELIEEILLVDDASEKDYLGLPLEEYISKLPVPVKVLRTGKRSGLIRARLIGAAEARGQVITFLDAHCECTVGWLEPLLDRIGRQIAAFYSLRRGHRSARSSVSTTKRFDAYVEYWETQAEMNLPLVIVPQRGQDEHG
ncbi:hypothetical protein JTE90_007744 [Oedothorax gibbosus]|uniref:Glycosyltransferase 2-like domain-containing protein n=1 Tax=Oedothorax gibbosus TaxID=931172 RepID=A0AAV6V7N2_9ARAC|nr:hypothetical protein JTE90_007744 [Oedothorax gibbosus]